MGRVDEACEFAFEFKRKYECRIESLERDIQDTFSGSTEEDQVINVNHASTKDHSLKNMIPITEVDQEEVKRTTPSNPENVGALRGTSHQLESYVSKVVDLPLNSSSQDAQVVDQLLGLECAFSLEEQFNCLKEKIMFFYSFTEKYILNTLAVNK